MIVGGHGIEIDLPDGWEGRLYRRRGAYPVLHAGSFALPHGDGDFGSGSIVAMWDGDVFVALLEYDPALAGTALFAAPGLPLPVRVTDLSPAAFRRRTPGRVAVQRFFNDGGRAFCLYFVLAVGGAINPRRRMREANRILRTVRIIRVDT